MIAVAPALSSLLAASGGYTRADLYTFTLVTGTVLRWAAFDRTVTSGGNSWSPVGVRFTRDHWKVSLGLETDAFNVTLSVDPANEPAIGGVPLRQAAERGLFDGAQLELDWAYLSGQPLALVGTLPRFIGKAGTAVADRLGVQLTVNSPLKLLDLQVPWKSYGPGCRWTLGDADCGVDLAAFAVTGTVAAGATAGTIPCSLGDAAGTWNLAQLMFSSGLNAGLRRSVRSSTPGLLQLASPLPWAPAAGDGFTILPGCDHTMPAFTVTMTVPSSSPWRFTVAPGASGYADLGVVYASGPHAGQAFLEAAGTPSTGQYVVSGNVYTFSAGDAGASVTVTYVAGPGNGTGTCRTRFNNLARFGGMPFIPAPETAY